MGEASGPETSLDVLTPLLQSLMIGAPALEALEPKPGLKPEPQADRVPEPKPAPKPKPAPRVEREADPSRCARCNVQCEPTQVSYETPCCRRRVCAACLGDALHERIQSDLWLHLGSAQWVGCLANSCQTLSAPPGSDVAHVQGTLPFDLASQTALEKAQRARSILEKIRPRPTRHECELAQRLHKALADHGLMLPWTETDSRAVSAPLFPVRSGFLTQPVPILTSMLKTEKKACTSCFAIFQTVDTSKEAAWAYVSSTFPGDWTWMVLGCPSKVVLPECGVKHSLNICPTCLPKHMFSGLEFLDGVSGGGNYRFVCPLCKHNLSPIQVERIARLIAPSRTPVTLSGFSISSTTPLSSFAKPAASPKAPFPLLGSSSKPKLFGGGLPKPSESENSPHKEALMSAIVSKKPNVKWDDVAGLMPAKHELQRAIVFPARFPNLYDEKRKASGAILLYGPPGTGKSYLAKAVATEVTHTFFSISSGDVVSKWMGESEKLVRQLFTLARENKPSIIFIDEIDALCSNREGSGTSEKGNEHSARMKTEILVQLDGLHSGSGSDDTGVVVLAATNLPWALDPAFRRRFEPRIHIPLPDRAARRQLFGIHSGKWGEMLSGEDLDELAGMTEGFSGSDIANAIKHALSVPLQKAQSSRFFRVVREAGEDMYTPCEAHEKGAVEMTWEEVPSSKLLESPVTAADFKQVLRDRRVKSSVGVGELRKYDDWTHEFGVEGSS